jgi:hypothetical protein
MGIWPQRRKRWGVGEAMDRKDGWLADAESAGAGVPEIEITSEMIDAGAEEFSRWSNGASMEFGDEKLAAECIFKAMISAAKARQAWRPSDRDSTADRLRCSLISQRLDTSERPTPWLGISDSSFEVQRENSSL